LETVKSGVMCRMSSGRGTGFNLLYNLAGVGSNVAATGLIVHGK